jgi:hypothetical protein
MLKQGRPQSRMAQMSACERIFRQPQSITVRATTARLLNTCKAVDLSGAVPLRYLENHKTQPSSRYYGDELRPKALSTAGGSPLETSGRRSSLPACVARRDAFLPACNARRDVLEPARPRVLREPSVASRAPTNRPHRWLTLTQTGCYEVV